MKLSPDYKNLTSADETIANEIFTKFFKKLKNTLHSEEMVTLNLKLMDAQVSIKERIQYLHDYLAYGLEPTVRIMFTDRSKHIHIITDKKNLEINDDLIESKIQRRYGEFVYQNDLSREDIDLLEEYGNIYEKNKKEKAEELDRAQKDIQTKLTVLDDLKKDTKKYEKTIQEIKEKIRSNKDSDKKLIEFNNLIVSLKESITNDLSKDDKLKIENEIIKLKNEMDMIIEKEHGEKLSFEDALQKSKDLLDSLETEKFEFELRQRYEENILNKRAEILESEINRNKKETTDVKDALNQLKILRESKVDKAGLMEPLKKVFMDNAKKEIQEDSEKIEKTPALTLNEKMEYQKRATDKLKLRTPEGIDYFNSIFKNEYRPKAAPHQLQSDIQVVKKVINNSESMGNAIQKAMERTQYNRFNFQSTGFLDHIQRLPNLSHSLSTVKLNK